MIQELKELIRAKRLVKKFCDINNITVPYTYISNLESCGRFKYSTPSKIYIDLSKCKLSNKRLNESFILDKTVTGVVIHELGHYIHLNFYKAQLYKKFKALKEPTIHYFEMDINEDIAESIRLFITNPTLLKEGRPKRFHVLSTLLSISETKHFTEKLVNLPLNLKDFTYKWIAKEI